MWLSILLSVGLIACLLLWRRTHQRAVENSALYEELVRSVQAEKAEALAQSAMHQAVFNSMVEGCLLLDSNQKILSVNRALLSLFQLDKSPEGQPLLEALRHHQLLDLLNTANATGKVEGFELHLPRGRARILQVNAAAVLDAQKSRVGTVLVFHDITRVKELENVRKDFVANVSHELRTPVTLVRSAVETLLDGAKDDPEARGRFLNTIGKQSERLTLLLDDLLIISELESGLTTINPVVTPLQPLVQELIDQLAPKAKEKQITITNSIKLEEVAYVDASRIEQVFMNLLDNAIKYIQPKASVEIGGERINGQTLKLYVHDTGPGIPKEACERIFERFYRIDKSRTRATGGTGLGLSIVKHIVQAHGGKVWVESQPGAGCAFYLTLPAGPSAQK